MRDDEGPGSRDPRQNTLLLQILAFAAIYIIWGSTYLAIRIGVRSLPPFLMAGCRFVTAGSILYAILRARGVSAPTLAEWGRAALAGLLMLTAGNGLVTWAETRIASNFAALLVAGVPLYVALLDWLRPGGVAPRRQVWIGISLGGIGMALLVMRGGSSSRETSGLAVVALLLSGLCWAAGSLYSRYGAMNANPLMAAAQQMIAGGSAQLLLAVVRGEPERMSLATLSGSGIAAFGYLTLIGSLVAFSAFGWLVKNSTPARLSTTAYVNPVVAVILGWALLDETLAPRALAGAALIICAVAVMTLRLPFRRRAEALPVTEPTTTPNVSLSEGARLTGGCQCGAVRLAVDASALGRASICHCRMCQKAFGNAFAPLVTARALTWTRGAPKRFRSSNRVQRGFCAECGTPLTYEPDGFHPEIAIAALDDPLAVRPVIQVGLESRLPWTNDLPALPTRSEAEQAKVAPFFAGIVSHQHPDHD